MKKAFRNIVDGGLIPFIIGLISGFLASKVSIPWNTPFIVILKENACLETTMFFYATVSFSWGFWIFLTALFPYLHAKFGEAPPLLRHLPYSFVTYGAATSGLILAASFTKSTNELGIKDPLTLTACIAVLFIFALLLPFTNQGDRKLPLNRFAAFLLGLGYMLVLPYTYCVSMLHFLKNSG